ncbi:TM223 protein, partial [Atractosteus spatula]|nr:TM223 protein [Atractosteus spatula]
MSFRLVLHSLCGRYRLLQGFELGPLCRFGPGVTRQCSAGTARSGWVSGLLALRSGLAQPVRGIVSANVPKDVLLFEHERTGFFRLMGLFCAGQFVFWTYLAHFAFTSLRDTGLRDAVIVGEEARNLPKLGGVSLNLGSNKWRYGFTGSCLTLGCLILAGGVLFSRRSVRRLVLCRGGQEVVIFTHSLLGAARGRGLTVPLRHISCVAHRTGAPVHIPFRVKGHTLYYLLDKKGRWPNPRLFDVTVGAYRPF